MLICQYCGRNSLTERSHKSHQSLCHSNPNRKIAKVDYSKRKSRNQFSKAKDLGLEVPKSKTKGITRIGKPHSEETKQKLSISAINRGFGGVTQSRWIRYNGAVLGSSYELILAKDLDKNQVEWVKPRRFEYIDPFGKKRTYTPDFYLPTFDLYLDPKNDFLIHNTNPRLGFRDIEKIELVSIQNKIQILILDKSQLSWDYIQNEISRLGVNGSIGPL